MAISLFINFDGNCREAVEYYAKAFETELQDMMTYDQMPKGSNPEESKKGIMYTELPIADSVIMFCDYPPDGDYKLGNNIAPSVSYNDMEKEKRIFHNLSQDGKILKDLGEMFWSKQYGIVKDKYGVIWHFNYNE